MDTFNRLVSQLETKLIRGSQINLSAREQNRLLRERAGQMIQEWDFPHARLVRALTEEIAAQCVEKSLEPNAPLRGGSGGFRCLAG